MSFMPTSAWRWYGLSAVAALLDQMTKSAIVKNYPLAEQVPITSFLNLIYVLNPGAAFSFLAGAGGWQRYFFIALALAVSFLLAFLLRHPLPRIESFGFSLILGGAMGNTFDRLLTGNVVDFLDLHWNGIHWPAFNLADVFISIGAVVVILASTKFSMRNLCTVGHFHVRRAPPSPEDT